MIERTEEIAAGDSAITTFICHPERHGPHPVILFYMDGPGVREELRDMARRFASVGYYVLLPNLYHRAGVLELGPPGSQGRKRIPELLPTIDIASVMGDTAALLAFAADDPAAADGAMAVIGYCMSGQFAVSAAAHFDRVRAAASIYGTHLMTEREDSPHRAMLRASAEFYVAYSEIDDWVEDGEGEAMAAYVRRHGLEGEVEVYPGAAHGFVFPERAIFHKPSAERHWERLFALFRRTIGPSR